jgi:hypothetical protein
MTIKITAEAPRTPRIAEVGLNDLCGISAFSAPLR